MSTWGEGNSLIQDLYPIRDLVDGFDAKSVMWVDVGGGYGQKTIALKRAILDLPGRFVVQDLPGTVQNAPKHEGIDFLGHDFFTEQPIKGVYQYLTPEKATSRYKYGSSNYTRLPSHLGAKAYYIRQCLHNWPADKCLTILTQFRKAMKPGYSKLFVHELIVPARGASTWVTTQDFNMMTLCATLERTEAQWKVILDEAGLKVVAVYPAPDEASEGVIEAELV
jgi:demethylsterigmatocystin 6-O-methyltransferase